MARYRHYDPQQTKLIAVAYGRQLLPGTFEHALSYLIDNENRERGVHRPWPAIRRFLSVAQGQA